MATRRKHGELVWGHVSEEEALAAIGSYYGPDDVALWGTPRLEHGYARWNVSSSWSDWDQCFAECDGPGRGRFKVTYVRFTAEEAPPEGGVKAAQDALVKNAAENVKTAAHIQESGIALLESGDWQK
jgi:hypothetical protein